MHVTNEETSADCNKCRNYSEKKSVDADHGGVCRDYSDFFLVNADHSAVCDIFSEERNKKSIALLSCPICPKIRSESLYDLAKKCIYYNRSGVCRLVTLSTLYFPK